MMAQHGGYFRWKLQFSDSLYYDGLFQILVLPGVLTLTSYAKPNVIRMGGALGDLVQWSDLLAGLHVLGHQVVIEYDIQRASRK